MKNEFGFFKKFFSNSVNKKDKLIITIDREHGSGGFEIASIIGKRLNIPVYDEDVIELKMLESSINPENIKKDDSFLQGTIQDLYRENYSYSQEDITNIDASFLANSKTIRDLAKQGSCILLGKCANYVLKGHEKTFDVFICADREYKIKRLMRVNKVDEEKAISHMKKKDNRRKNHYNKFSGGNWGCANEYDLCINSSSIDNEFIADLIIKTSTKKE
ncbi:Cytidylate kinase [Anaerosphaera aminiphila DSM 21120]|uniref:Cytidylate kinase n=1 Tax=Anaerosphaera aminiphila DSM 21120 TaxID=1120995 RepID=A0A1M5UTH6_9FIRM|nr:cytidylate kinase-like family protein [Anaerosphaera aminiphila]SHH66033.1 Cytidylate kinase [Anaerosphaera aminiphila DSM 21120]